MRARVPVGPRMLLWVLAAPEERSFLLADLEERFGAIALERGLGVARRWYWWQALRSVPVVVAGRVSGRRPSSRSVPGFLQDVRFALRVLRRNRRFAAVATFTLAIGIAASTVLFGAVDVVLFRTLPVPEPDRLVLFSWESATAELAGSVDDRPEVDASNALRRSRSFSTLAYQRFRVLRTELGLAHVFAFARFEQANLAIDGAAEIASGQFVSADYHAGLGVSPALGRMLTPADSRPDAPPALVINHAYWSRRFGADPSVLGRTISVNGIPFTVVGVTAPSFSGALELGETPDITIPLALEPLMRPGGDSNLDEPWNWWLFVMGRLDDDVSTEAVPARLAAVFRRTVEEGWDAMPAEVRARPEFQGPRELPRLRVTSGARGLAGYATPYGDRIRVLALVAVAILLIACGNVAGLLLARSQARQTEVAVQRALGASRARVVRQLVAEGMILALAAATLGVLLAYLGSSSIMAWLPLGNGAAALPLEIDARVLAFAAALAVLTGGLVGAVPGVVASADSADRVLRGSGRTTRRMRGGFRAGVTVAQVGLSFVLLTLAGLFAATLRNLEREDLGFDPAGLLVFRIDPRLSAYRGAEIGTLYESLVERLEALPGVASVTLSRHALLAGSYERTGGGLFVRTPDGRLREGTALVHRVRWNFPATMNMPVLAGRSLAGTDDENAPKVVLVNEAFVRRHLDVRDPNGARVSFESPDNDSFEIVGVVRDAKYTSQRETASPTVYVPYTQAGFTQMSFAIRSATDLSRLARAVREAVAEVDPSVPIFEMTTQAVLATHALSTERRLTWIASAFSGVALFLTCLALYGTISYQVSRQAPEIGIRMALGATRQRVVGSVLRHTLTLVGAGLFVGLLATLPAGRIIADQLFGLDATAAEVRLNAALVILCMTMLATYLPARRAARVDPMMALRSE